MSYDTVKTLKGVLANCLELGSATQTGIHLFSAHPRKRLEEDSLTLAEVGMCPNGVLHLRGPEEKESRDLEDSASAETTSD